MIVVSDTSPLNYLILIGKEEVLPLLFGRVILPGAVARELAHPRAPESVRLWIASPPAWAEVRSPSHIDPPAGLGQGEREAIALATELNCDLLLVDDRPARRAAARQGLATTGTLGVLELAAAHHVIDLCSALEALRQTDFRIADNLLQAALDRHLKRQTQAKQ